MNAWLEPFATAAKAASPPAAEDGGEAPYADFWLEMRRRRRALVLNPAGGFAMLAALALLTENVAALRPYQDTLLPLCALSVFLGWTISLVRYGFFRCPRCGGWFSGQRIPDPAIDRVLPRDPQACSHCSLAMWSVNEAGLTLRKYERALKAKEAAQATPISPSTGAPTLPDPSRS